MKVEDNSKQPYVKFSEIEVGHVFKDIKHNKILYMKMDEVLRDCLDHNYNAIGIERGTTVFIPDDELVEPIENIKVVIE